MDRNKVFGKEKKFIPHNVNCLRTPITSSSLVQIFSSALDYWTQIFSGVLKTVYVQTVTQLQVQWKREIFEVERIKERRWSQTVAGYQYTDVHKHWWKEIMNGLLTQLKNKIFLKYKLEILPTELSDTTDMTTYQETSQHN
jgi:hypothetical protein